MEGPWRAPSSRPSIRIGVVRIAAVDNDVAFFEKRQQFFDDLINGVSGLDHHHDAPRTLQRADQFLYGVSAHNQRAGRFMLNKIVDLGHSAVKHGNFVSVVVHVQDQVLPHHGKADESDVTALRLHKLSHFTRARGMWRI